MGKNIAIIVLAVVVAALATILLISRKCVIGSMTNIVRGKTPAQYIEVENGILVTNTSGVLERAGTFDCNCDDGTRRECYHSTNPAGCGQCCGREIRK